MIEAVAAGAAYFVFVFFKAVQQRNVAFMHYRWVMPISYLMSTTEVFVISVVAVKAVGADSWMALLPFVLGIGTGGGLGAIIAMFLHNKYITKKEVVEVGPVVKEKEKWRPLTKAQLRHRDWVEDQLGD